MQENFSKFPILLQLPSLPLSQRQRISPMALEGHSLFRGHRGVAAQGHQDRGDASKSTEGCSLGAEGGGGGRKTDWGH